MRYRLAPFVVGSYEAQAERMDHELAHLVEAYFDDGGTAGIMGPEPALHRVIPAQAAVKSEWVLPYDDVRAILLNSKTFHVRDCICRIQQDHLGHKCRFPVTMCLSFSALGRPPAPGDISREDALAVLDRAEEVGLVHTVSNVAEGIGYVCNCCGCCCGVLRTIKKHPRPAEFVSSPFRASLDGATCTDCGVCLTRCPMDALHRAQDGSVKLNPDRCIGCGLCVSTCTERSLVLIRKPEAEQREVPATFTKTYIGMARERGKLKPSKLAKAWVRTKIKAKSGPRP